MKVNNLSHVIGLLQDLHNETTADDSAKLEAFKTYAQWCKEQAQDDGHQHRNVLSGFQVHSILMSGASALTDFMTRSAKKSMLNRQRQWVWISFQLLFMMSPTIPSSMCRSSTHFDRGWSGLRKSQTAK